MSDLTTIEQHNAHRAETWSKVWALTASANDCKSEAIATSWADKCLQTYDLIFTSLEFIKDHRDCWVNTWAAYYTVTDDNGSEYDINATKDLIGEE